MNDISKQFYHRSKIDSNGNSFIQDFSNLSYNNDYEKASLAKSLNLDLMIDDRKSIYENMKNVNIDCILFGDKIKTWKEVLEYINSKEGNNWKE